MAVPIYLTQGDEKELIIKDAVRQIKELRDELGVQELTASADLAPTGELETGLDYNPERGPSD